MERSLRFLFFDRHSVLTLCTLSNLNIPCWTELRWYIEKYVFFYWKIFPSHKILSHCSNSNWTSTFQMLLLFPNTTYPSCLFLCDIIIPKRLRSSFIMHAKKARIVLLIFPSHYTHNGPLCFCQQQSMPFQPQIMLHFEALRVIHPCHF